MSPGETFYKTMWSWARWSRASKVLQQTDSNEGVRQALLLCSRQLYPSTQLSNGERKVNMGQSKDLSTRANQWSTWLSLLNQFWRTFKGGKSSATAWTKSKSLAKVVFSIITRSRAAFRPKLKCIIGGNSQTKSLLFQQSLPRISNSTSVGAELIGRKRCKEIPQTKRASLQRVIKCHIGAAADMALYSPKINKNKKKRRMSSTLRLLKSKAQGRWWSNLDLPSKIVPSFSHCLLRLSACSNKSVTQRRRCPWRAHRSTKIKSTILMDEARKRQFESGPVKANRCSICITIRSVRLQASWLTLSTSLPDRTMWRQLRSATLTSLLKAHNISIQGSLTHVTRQEIVRQDPQLKLSLSCASQATPRTIQSQFLTQTLPIIT